MTSLSAALMASVVAIADAGYTNRLHRPQTCGGSLAPAGAPAPFPCRSSFQYGGSTYSQCTTADSGEPWCMIDGLGNWANCNCTASSTEQPKKHGFLTAVAEHQQKGQPLPYDHPEWLMECRKIYLDIGANMGVQVRKLFEPEQYPGADIVQAFDRIYGPAVLRRATSSQTGLCALGLEPNPQHLPRLHDLEEAYADRGWNAHFYPLAAWREEGHLGFNMTGPRDNVEDGTNTDAHLDSKDDGTQDADYTVRTIDLADFVSTLPVGTVKLMKMDIEGAEYETLSSMLQQSTLCSDRVAEAFIEVHPWGETRDWLHPHVGNPFTDCHPRSFGAIQQRLGELSTSGRCGQASVTTFSELDDETYVKDVDSDFANLFLNGGGDSAAELDEETYVKNYDRDIANFFLNGGGKSAAELDDETFVKNYDRDTANLFLNGGVTTRPT